MKKSYWPTWVEINLDNIAHNIKEIKKRVGQEVELMAVVKANAYGYGIVEVASTVLENGATKLGVATVDEGILLRERGIKAPILVLAPILEDAIEMVIKYDLMQTVFTLELAKSLSEEAVRQGKTAYINIKINTGMNRFGVTPDLALDLVKEINTYPNLFIEGIFTHLATSYIEEEFTNLQFDRFIKVIKELEEENIHIPYKHCCNSAGVLSFPHMHLNQVRPGVIISAKEEGLNEGDNLDLRDSFEFKSKVISIQNVPKDNSIGYNQLFTTNRDTKIAIIAAGWADGVPRGLTNKGYVLIRGKRWAIVGRVGCDAIFADITESEDISIEDEVVLLGKQGNEEIECSEWSRLVGGFSSTLTFKTLITERPKKIYIKNNNYLD